MLGVLVQGNHLQHLVGPVEDGAAGGLVEAPVDRLRRGPRRAPEDQPGDQLLQGQEPLAPQPRGPGLQLVALAHVGGYGDDLGVVVVLLQPGADDGCVQVMDWMNNYPRKILDYSTPAELFQEELKNLLE